MPLNNPTSAWPKWTPPPITARLRNDASRPYSSAAIPRRSFRKPERRDRTCPCARRACFGGRALSEGKDGGRVESCAMGWLLTSKRAPYRRGATTKRLRSEPPCQKIDAHKKRSDPFDQTSPRAETGY